jgi:hypothetical protein
MATLENFKEWVAEMKTEITNMPLINRTYLELIRFRRLTNKIAEIEAVIWISEHPEDITEFIAKLPFNGNKNTYIIRYSYANYKRIQCKSMKKKPTPDRGCGI